MIVRVVVVVLVGFPADTTGVMTIGADCVADGVVTVLTGPSTSTPETLGCGFVAILIVASRLPPGSGVAFGRLADTFVIPTTDFDTAAIAAVAGTEDAMHSDDWLPLPMTVPSAAVAAAAVAACCLASFCALAALTNSFSRADDSRPIFCACATVSVRGIVDGKDTVLVVGTVAAFVVVATAAADGGSVGGATEVAANVDTVPTVLSCMPPDLAGVMKTRSPELPLTTTRFEAVFVANNVVAVADDVDTVTEGESLVAAVDATLPSLLDIFLSLPLGAVVDVLLTRVETFAFLTGAAEARLVEAAGLICMKLAPSADLINCMFPLTGSESMWIPPPTLLPPTDFLDSTIDEVAVAADVDG